MDALDVGLCAIVPQVYTGGPAHSHADGPCYLVEDGDQLVSLLCKAMRVEDGPDVQWDLRTK